MACQCGDCTIMHDVLLFLPRNLRECEKIIREGIDCNPRPLFLGLYTRANWEGHAGLFVFKCRGCQAAQRGFACFNLESRYSVVHFHCAYCDYERNFASDPQTYDEVGVPRLVGSYASIALGMTEPICPRAAG